MIDSPLVDAVAIGIETLNRTVMLSGFARSSGERAMAETLTCKGARVKSVKNEIAVRH